MRVITRPGVPPQHGFSCPTSARTTTASMRPHLHPRGACSEHARRCLNGSHDVLVTGTAAEVSREGDTDIVVRGVRVVAQEADEAHQEARRAKPALQSVALPKCLLQRMQALAVSEALDGQDLGGIDLDGEEKTRAHRRAVDYNRARATHTVLAPEVRAGQAQLVAQEVGEEAPDVHSALVEFSIDTNADPSLVHRRPSVLSS